MKHFYTPHKLCFGGVCRSHSVNWSVGFFFVRAISLLLRRFHSNFIGSFSMKRRCAYHNLVTVNSFSKELWPFHEYFCPLYFSVSTRWISNFMGSFSMKQRCACNNFILASCCPFMNCFCPLYVSISTALISVKLHGHYWYEVQICKLQFVFD